MKCTCCGKFTKESELTQRAEYSQNGYIDVYHICGKCYEEKSIDCPICGKEVLPGDNHGHYL